VGDLLHHGLEETAEAVPERLAVVDGDASVTYGELDARANRLAGHLAGLGVGAGDRVALCVPKSIDAVVGLYGILKAGAAYVPLDPNAPATRLATVLGDAEAAAVVRSAATEVLLAEAGGGGGGAVVAVDGELDGEPGQPPPTTTGPGDLGYILYTSGSTGTPKGVMLTHGNGMAFAGWAATEFGLHADDRVAGQAPFHFDLSTFDLFSTFAAGATLVLVPDRALVFPSLLSRFVDEQQITVLYAVPSLLTVLATRGGLEAGALPTLRSVLFAGEVFPVRNLRQLMELLPAARFANLYGPTETNVCCWYDVTELPDVEAGPVPIGRAIPGDRLAAVTDEGALAPAGELGELCVTGDTVMVGYRNDPGRTAERLVEVPGLTEPGELAYRTGDLVVLGEDGDYRFVGRRDNQVKTRGYRVELGDVEAAIAANPAVVDCAVVAVPDEAVSNRLVAYVVASGDADLAADCAQRVPKYMVPERFEVVPGLPTTSTGKVDRTRLTSEATALLS
jgi:L-proline---[L-prolyl-carrier protein] ligase